MKPHILLITITTFLTSVFQASAQTEAASLKPPGIGNRTCKPLSEVHTIYFPEVDNNALLIKDSIESLEYKGLKSFNFGYTLQADYGIDNSGTLEILPD